MHRPKRTLYPQIWLKHKNRLKSFPQTSFIDPRYAKHCIDAAPSTGQRTGLDQYLESHNQRRLHGEYQQAGVTYGKRQSDHPPTPAGQSCEPLRHLPTSAAVRYATANRQFKNILLVLAYTELRPGELRALSWGDIDFEKKILHVRRNLTQQKMQFKLPKTNRTRTVHLLPPALNALQDQFKITGALLDAEIDMHLPGGMIVRQTLRPVFRPTKVVPDRPPFYSGVFLAALWQAAIKKSGVRYRRAYQLRHTYASWNITAHGNLAFIAEQMGHNSARMLQEVYGKWIESASRSEVDSIWSSMQKNGHLPQ
ncbi:site-specific integrase [Aeromonas sp. R2-2]|uniref:site-specific integrase n=1 Tax=Aeromonas TaxID=642 RepID=UPI0034A2876C